METGVAGTAAGGVKPRIVKSPISPESHKTAR
jgi:hypothetical protein